MNIDELKTTAFKKLLKELSEKHSVEDILRENLVKARKTPQNKQDITDLIFMSKFQLDITKFPELVISNISDSMSKMKSMNLITDDYFYV